MEDGGRETGCASVGGVERERKGERKKEGEGNRYADRQTSTETDIETEQSRHIILQIIDDCTYNGMGRV